MSAMSVISHSNWIQATGIADPLIVSIPTAYMSATAVTGYFSNWIQATGMLTDFLLATYSQRPQLLIHNRLRLDDYLVAIFRMWRS